MNLKTKIRIGHSPDPDDAFMFYAIAQGRIPANGFDIEHVIEEIESLNQRAFRGELEITALSCHAYALVSDRYQLLPYGSSVGDGYGPMVVGKAVGATRQASRTLKGSRIAVPGRYTTAYLVLRLYEPDFTPLFVPFEEVFLAIEEGRADFGLLIHEGQLTYGEKGFRKIVDLGEWWQQAHGLPLPLGMNAIRRNLDQEVKTSFSDLFIKSIRYAMDFREEALRYALRFGRGIDRGRGDRFVGMYVNQDSLRLRDEVKRSLHLLFDLAWRKNFLPEPVKLEILE
jgi:1,4-dihydroxy-6-naphthoate synthase